MAVYKDKKRGTWYTSFPYVDWTGKRCRKLKRGFLTKKEAQNWENHFKLQKANSLDMTFEDFYGIYEADVKPKIRYNTWCTKEHIIKTKILPYFKDLSMRDITPRDPREIFKSSILSNATSMILIHNHPSGNLEPSKWDTILTDRMLKLGELIGIPVVDHIIVGGENKEYFSFKEKGILEFEHNSFEIDYRKLDAERFAVAENEIDHVVTPRRRRSR